MSLTTLALMAFSMSLLATVHFAGPQAHSDPAQAPSEARKAPAALNFTMKDIEGRDVDLAKYHGKVVLIVNVASECGLTPQYKDLQALYEKHKDQGLVVLGFPANEFGEQEPGSNDDIKAFCESKYSVTFPMFAKVVVKGEDICPLYRFLTSSETNPKFAGEIKWNFTKFLLGRDGAVVNRFEPKVTPSSEEVTKAIEAELAKQSA